MATHYDPEVRDEVELSRNVRLDWDSIQVATVLL